MNLYVYTQEKHMARRQFSHEYGEIKLNIIVKIKNKTTTTHVDTESAAILGLLYTQHITFSFFAKSKSKPFSRPNVVIQWIEEKKRESPFAEERQ